MKIKRLIGIMLSGVLLLNTIPVGAFSNSGAGYWAGNPSIPYKYNSDGTLIIEGSTGTESSSEYIQTGVGGGSDLYSNWSTDIKAVYVDNLDEFGCIPSGNSKSATFYNSNFSTTYPVFDYLSLNVAELNSVLYGAPNLKTLVFGDNVRHINKKFMYNAPPNGLTIYMPSTIEYIDELAFYCNGGTVAEFDITVVCEYGSTAYNWAVAFDNRFPNGTVNIELADVLAKSNVEVDNSQNYQVVVPETISFSKSEDGWSAHSFLGVVGSLNGYITVKTNKSFKVVGEDDPSSENVTVTTDDGDEDGGFLKTRITKEGLANATDDIDINGTPTIGYRIDYDCKVDSERIMRQKYVGTLNYIISEE